ncbi:aminoglycoside phosphotransferase family protein [Dermabacteraceae bacterium P13101]
MLGKTTNGWPRLPDELYLTLSHTLKDKTDNWVTNAVETAALLASKWGFSPDSILTGGSLSLCTRGELIAEGSLAVLKIPTDPLSGIKESRALSLWKKAAVPRIFEIDETTGAFLMEYLPPSKSEKFSILDMVNLWKSLENKTAEKIFSETAVNNFSMRVEWALDRFDPDLEKEHILNVELSNLLFMDLCTKSPSEEYLLHGDFQDKNMYYSGKRLVLLDPLPCVGPRLYDIALWIALTPSGLEIDNLVHKVADLLSIDFRLLLKWTWCIAAVENRPYQSVGAERRQRFIDAYSKKW